MFSKMEKKMGDSFLSFLLKKWKLPNFAHFSFIH